MVQVAYIVRFPYFVRFLVSKITKKLSQLMIEFQPFKLTLLESQKIQIQFLDDREVI